MVTVSHLVVFPRKREAISQGNKVSLSAISHPRSSRASYSCRRRRVKVCAFHPNISRSGGLRRSHRMHRVSGNCKRRWVSLKKRGAQRDSRTRVVGSESSMVVAFCGDLCGLPQGRASRPTPRFNRRGEKDLSPFGGREGGGVRVEKRAEIPPLGLSDCRTFLHLIGSRRAKITKQTGLLLAA